LLSVVGQDLPDRTSRDQEIDVSTPGAGGPQPPEQDPSQPAQPTAGQQPPAGQPWGPPPQQQWSAQQQPQQPQQPWGAPQPPAGQAFGQPEKPKRKWLPIVGGLVALIVVLGVLSSFLGAGDPEVGDCVKPDGLSFETVGCDDDEAAAKIIGTDADMTGEEFDAADVNGLCTDYANATSVLWYGTSNDEEGQVYCAEDL
jgi:hypothetical protein